MAETSTSTMSLYLLAGMKAELSIPRINANPKSPFAAQGKYVSETGEEVTLQNGFYVEDTKVGDIESVSIDKVAITYLHKKAEKNTIWFIAADGIQKARFDIISVPIHDHSTIVQGGPAYGTYFSDSEED